MKRLLTAAVLIPLIYLYVMKLPVGYYVGMLVIVSLIAQSEFHSIYNVKGSLRYTGAMLGVAIIMTAYLSERFLTEVIILSFLIIAGMRLFLKKDPAESLYEIAPVIVGLIYIPLLLSLQIGLRRQGPQWIIFLFGAIWASDSLAYYMGKGIGRRKLYREVSPNKTVEGALGSVIGGALGAVLLNAFLKTSLPAPTVLVIGVVIGAVSIIGDLVESMFKRDRGIKDSGSIIPGHGGLLDKLDSMLFACPIFYWMLMASGVIKG